MHLLRASAAAASACREEARGATWAGAVAAAVAAAVLSGSAAACDDDGSDPAKPAPEAATPGEATTGEAAPEATTPPAGPPGFRRPNLFRDPQQIVAAAVNEDRRKLLSRAPPLRSFYNGPPRPRPPAEEEGVPKELWGIPGKVLMPGAEELEGVGFSDVCGLEDAKRRLVAAVVEPSRNGALLRELQERTRAGGAVRHKAAGLVVLHGPPGSGKTMLARAAAAATQCPVVVLGFEDIGDKFYGETPRKLQAVLDAVSGYARSGREAMEEAGAAGEASPLPGAARSIIVFLDEADAFFPRRPTRGTDGSADRDNTKTDDRLVSQALRYIDGLEDREGVVMVLATNRKSAIDPAVMSRASEVISVPAPDDDARRALWQRNAKHLDDVSALVRKTDGLTGRDVVRACDAVERMFVSERREGLPAEGDYLQELTRRRDDGSKVKDRTGVASV